MSQSVIDVRVAPRRHGRLGLLAIGATVLAVLVLSVGCAPGGSSSEEKSERVLRVAVVDNPPLSSLQGGKGTGVCPDMLNAALREAGFPEPEWVLASDDADLVAGLVADRWDVIGACLQISPERCESIAHLNPLATDNFSVAVQPGNPARVTSLAASALDGTIRMGVVRGSIASSHLGEVGFAADRTVTFGGLQDALDALDAGDIQGVFGSRAGLYQLSKDAHDLVDVNDVDLHPAGAAVRNEEANLLADLNAGLEAIKENGVFERITDQYGLKLNRTIQTTAAEICAG